MKIHRCWKDVIRGYDDKAELLRCHSPKVLQADPPLLHTFPLCPLYLFNEVNCSGPSCCFLLVVYFCCSVVLAEFQYGCLGVRPRPRLPCWKLLTVYTCLRAVITSTTALAGLLFRPVTKVGALLHTAGSCNSFNGTLKPIWETTDK